MKKLAFTAAFLFSLLSAVPLAELSSAMPSADAVYEYGYIKHGDMVFNFREDRENELILRAYSGTDETVVVPEIVDGYPVTGIGDYAFVFNGQITNAKYVTLPDSIDYFGYEIFERSKLVSVNIPRNLKIIPCLTFRECKELETVVFHDGIVAAAENAFEGTNIEIPPDILVSKQTTIDSSYCTIYEEQKKPFCYNDFKLHFDTDDATGILYCYIDGYNGNSTDVIIPEKLHDVQVKSIDLSNSSPDKSEITSVEFPETDIEISIDNNSLSRSLIKEFNANFPCSVGKSAFSNCKNLNTVVFDHNAVLDSKAFIGCTSLNSAVFNSDVSVAEQAFRDCTSLTSVDFMGKVDLKRDTFMDCTALENVSLDISQNITGSAFDSCTSLVNINNKPVFDSTTGEFVPEYNDFIRNNFYMAEDVGFINQYAEYQYKKVVAENTDDSMSDIEKVKVLHDWVCEHTQYADSTEQPEYHTDASILLNDSTVCEGYAKACNLLFNYAGIETCYVNSFDHAWNIVKIGGHYFHVDATWDDGENISYNHFMKSDSDIRDDGSHNEWTLYKPTSLHDFQKNQLPECNYSIGDTNMDGTFNIADAVKMTGFLLGSNSETEENIVLYDMNYDGKTDVFDMILMRGKLTE